MNDQTTTIQEVKNKVEKFVADRDWNQFHDAKNLSMAIATEAAELMEHFRWLDGNESSQAMKNKGQAIEEEIADIAFLTLRLCSAYNIDLTTIMTRKIEISSKKYPIEKCKGKREKYTEL